MATKAHYQIVYFPYLSLGDRDELRLGNLAIWNADRMLNSRIPDKDMRDRVRALLRMNRTAGREAENPAVISGMGVVTIGATDFRPFTRAQISRIKEMQLRLFLGGLGNNAGLKVNVNAGHRIYTTENFTFVTQNFDLTSPYVSETTGLIVQTRIGGLTIDKTRWFRPSHVPSPSPFRTDDALLTQLEWVKREDLVLYRRILRAAAVFMESYYNAMNVDINARILLQVMAFEILLDIPENEQRKHFKERLGKLCRVRGDRRDRTRSFRSERHGGRLVTERGNIKAIWADRVYTLRNHLIHGNKVSPAEYVFKGKQHHLVAGTIVFVGALKALIDQARLAAGDKRAFTEALRWIKWKDRNDQPERDYEGFAMETDWRAIFLNKIAHRGRSKRYSS